MNVVVVSSLLNYIKSSGSYLTVQVYIFTGLPSLIALAWHCTPQSR